MNFAPGKLICLPYIRGKQQKNRNSHMEYTHTCNANASLIIIVLLCWILIYCDEFTVLNIPRIQTVILVRTSIYFMKIKLWMSQNEYVVTVSKSFLFSFWFLCGDKIDRCYLACDILVNVTVSNVYCIVWFFVILICLW